MQQNSEIIIYKTGANEISMQTRLQDETVWLNRHQIAELFNRDIKTIGKHINNIFKKEELIKKSVVANFATTAEDGKTYQVEYYPNVAENISKITSFSGCFLQHVHKIQ